MSQTAITNILLEAGTNELEIVEFYLDEALTVWKLWPRWKDMRHHCKRK